jgi:hypothetical protein
MGGFLNGIPVDTGRSCLTQLQYDKRYTTVFFYAKKTFNARRLRQNISRSTFLLERQGGRKRKRAADETFIPSSVECCSNQ